jgi:trehalose/maltose hydrolase-like predicted phosphorylase
MKNWIINYKNFDSASQKLRETILTLGNGYFATRGAHEDGLSSFHYPGTYIAGVYNRLSSSVAGKKLINEDLVNVPNWLAISFKIENDWFDITQVEIISFREILHLKKGLTKRILQFKDCKGRTFTLNTIRFVSQHNPHLAGLSYSIFSHDWEGDITIRSSICGAVSNNGVERYRELNNRHIDIVEKGAFNNDCLFMQVRTKSSDIKISEAVRTEIYLKNKKTQTPQIIIEEGDNIHQEFNLKIRKNEKIRVIKLLSLYTSKDQGIFESNYEAKLNLKRQVNFAKLLKNHISAWKYLWDTVDIQIEAEDNTQKLIRLHIFHALQTLSKHSINLDYGVPARGLHGEAYRGHVFWDEIFVLPFFIFHFPEIVRSMLMYRYQRLNSARELAKRNGYKGAMFPWQSGSNGEEETQKYHLNPQSGKWGPDKSLYQRHVNFAIVYNINAYYQATKDSHFFTEYGAEIIFEIAKLISSMVHFNPNKKRYEITNVMGPDEYHESYPGSVTEGVNNNSYTNVMAVWVLEKALELTKILNPEKLQFFYASLEISLNEIDKWKDITHKMYIPINKGILSQFEGYEELKEFDWNLYKEKYDRIERLDRILKAENQNPNEFKIAKQPDVLMLFYLLDDTELERIFNQLGYSYDVNLKSDTIDYYLKRTSHGSTLSKITFAQILTDIDSITSAKLFQEALISDLHDTQGGTTTEGIHLGVMVSTVFLLFKSFAGMNLREGKLILNPRIPKWISRLNFKFKFNQNLYQIEIFKAGFQLKLLEKNNDDLGLIYKNEVVQLNPDKPPTFYSFIHEVKQKENMDLGVLYGQIQKRNLE